MTNAPYLDHVTVTSPNTFIEPIDFAQMRSLLKGMSRTFPNLESSCLGNLSIMPFTKSQLAMEESDKLRVMKETEFLYHHSNWLGSSTNIKVSVAEMDTIVNGIQICGFQDCLLQYMSETNFPIDFEMINRIRRTPVPLSDRSKAEVQFKSLNSFSNIQRWMVKMFSDVDKFVQVSDEYFRKTPQDLEFFAAVTFPNVCFHFATFEFDELGAKICLEFLNKSVDNCFWPFCSAYLRRLPSFEDYLWRIFDNRVCRNATAGDLFDSLLKSFRHALPILSAGQKRVLMALIEKSRDLFAKLFIGKLIRRSYVRSHLDQNVPGGQDAFIELLDFLEDGSLPHIGLLVKEFEMATDGRVIPSQSMMRNLVKTPIIVCPHDCLLIQKLLEFDPFFAKSVIASLRFPEECAGQFEPRSVGVSVLSLFKDLRELDPVHMFHVIPPIPSIKDQSLQRRFLMFKQAVNLPVRHLHQLLYSYERHETSALIALEKKNLNSLKNDPDFCLYACCQFHEMFLKQFDLLEEHLSRLHYLEYYDDLLKDIKKQLTLSLKVVFGKLEHVDKHNNARSTGVAGTDKKILPAYSVVGVKTCFNVIDEALRAGKVLKASNFSSSGSIITEKKPGSGIAMIMTGGSLYDVAELLGSQTFKQVDGFRRRVGRRNSVEGTLASSSNFKKMVWNGIQKLAQPDSKVIYTVKLLDEFPGHDVKLRCLAKQFTGLLREHNRRIMKESQGCEVHALEFKHVVDQCLLFEARKRGSNALELVEISKAVNQLAVGCKGEYGKKDSYYICLLRVLVMSSSASLFKAYVWLSKVLFAFPDFKTWFTPSDQQALNVLTANMKRAIQSLSETLAADVTQCTSYIYS